MQNIADSSYETQLLFEQIAKRRDEARQQSIKAGRLAAAWARANPEEARAVFAPRIERAEAPALQGDEGRVRPSRRERQHTESLTSSSMQEDGDPPRQALHKERTFAANADRGVR